MKVYFNIGGKLFYLKSIPRLKQENIGGESLTLQLDRSIFNEGLVVIGQVRHKHSIFILGLEEIDYRLLKD
jgi:hypothetical protein